MCDEVRLVRHDGGLSPWGFRITGGRDFGTPLLVVKVVGGSIAALAGVQVGDLIRGINYVPTNDFTHLDAQRAILESGDTLILNLLRGGEYEQPEPPPPPPVPVIPVIDIQSPEDKEVEEIGQQEVSEDFEMSFVVHLDRSGRISAVEEISSPSFTPRTTPVSRSSSSSGGKRRKSSGSRSGKTPPSEESDKKRKVSVTINDDGPIDIKPPSYEDATRRRSSEKKGQGKQEEVTLHEEMRTEELIKKTTTEIKEKTEKEFIMGVRDEILARAHKEKRELTEEEIAEMMAGEAEVIEASKGKEVIGVNFQKFIPKCDFIKDSEVFKVLQEEQIKKEKSEEDQLEKDPLRRFSKFLIKPKTAKPMPKPKAVHPDLLPWQQRLNSSSVSDQTSPIASSHKTDEESTGSLKTEELVKDNKEIVTQDVKKETESVSISTTKESEENSTVQKNENQDFNEAIKKNEDDIDKVEDYKAEEELEMIDWEESRGGKRKDSNEIYSQKRSSSEEGRRSKSKKVGFYGTLSEEDFEKQLTQVQKEVIALQKLPGQIQDHLLKVQLALIDILTLQNKIKTPVNDETKIEATEIYTYNPDGDYEVDEVSGEKGDEVLENVIESSNETEDEHGSQHKDISSSKEVTSSVEGTSTITSEKCEQDELSHEEVKIEESNELKENETAKEIKEDIEKEEKQDLPHGQEDVEICVSKGKPTLPLTPQLRPLVLPGGRKWFQPKDAYTEEYIAETLVSQSEVLVGTTIGVNFQKYIPPKFDTSNSAVYRLIHDIEERTKKGVAERPEKIHGLEEFYHPPIDKRHFYAAELAEKKYVDNVHQQSSEPAHH